MISAQSRRSRPSRPLRTHIAVALWLVSGLAWPTPVGSTPYFWVSAFERQWQQDEAIIPGFWGQGKRILLSEHPEQILLVPSCLQSFHLDAHFRRLLAFEQIDHHVP